MGKDHQKVKGLVGIYYRESTERTHRGRPDRRYWFSYRDSRGKFRWEAVGWASEGITPQYANQKRIERLNLMRHGENPGIKKALPSLDEVAEAFFEIDEIERTFIRTHIPLVQQIKSGIIRPAVVSERQSFIFRQDNDLVFPTGSHQRYSHQQDTRNNMCDNRSHYNSMAIPKR